MLAWHLMTSCDLPMICSDTAYPALCRMQQKVLPNLTHGMQTNAAQLLTTISCQLADHEHQCRAGTEEQSLLLPAAA